MIPQLAGILALIGVTGACLFAACLCLIVQLASDERERPEMVTLPSGAQIDVGWASQFAAQRKNWEWN